MQLIETIHVVGELCCIAVELEPYLLQDCRGKHGGGKQLKVFYVYIFLFIGDSLF